MPGEERCHESAAPERAGHPQKQPEEQYGICGVKNHVGEVLRAGIEAEERAIQRVREPRERMPLARVAGGKSPGESVPAQGVLDIWIAGNVDAVVGGNESE